MRPLTLLVLASLLVAATGAAAAPQGATQAQRHWALAWGHHAAEPSLDMAHGAVACMLGDVNGDGAQDMLVRMKDQGKAKLVALSGADAKTLWENEVAENALLQCAPDVAGDGVADPLLVVQEAASSATPGGAPVSSQQVLARLQGLSGATGEAVVAVEATQRATAGGAASVSGGTRSDVSLSTAGAGLYLVVVRERTSAVTSLLEEVAFSSRDTDVTMEVLDAAGERLGVIETPPQADVLAHAIVAAKGEASVLLLTAADASPLDQAPARVPTIASYAVDGTLRWSVELAATTQDLMLVPRAGDIDADGVQDLIVETLPAGFGLPGGAMLAVLSGASGKLILERASDNGFLAALPFGDVTPELPGDGDALLVLTQTAQDAPLTLECVKAKATCWTSKLPANAMPVNGALDPFTGDIQGFHDLTGDGVPDVATLVEQKEGAVLSVLDGIDGAEAWSTQLPAGAQVVPVPTPEGVDLAVLEPMREETRTLVLSLLDGADGQVRWAARANVAAELSDTHAHVASSYDGEAVLLTIGEEHVHVLDSLTGRALWSGATTIGGAAPGALEVTGAAREPRGLAAMPAPGALLVVAAVGALALALRRRE